MTGPCFVNGLWLEQSNLRQASVFLSFFDYWLNQILIITLNFKIKCHQIKYIELFSLFIDLIMNFEEKTKQNKKNLSAVF